MPCGLLLNSWVLILVLIGSGEEVRFQRLVDRSAPLDVGATENDVLRLIGEPGAKWDARRGLATFIFGKRPAQWIYGTTIDLEAIIIPELPFPNPIPIKLRLFGAHDGDLIIDWNLDKRVSKVKRPELEIPDGVAELYDSVCFLVHVARMFAANGGS